ncbi:hypothetical protein MPOCJGCO_4831 [Methylobacterium trifolii]|uniref:Uncharacterized protein n=1 Tax=Methylobacterium trifolii TaxID=1003092 RepID=A0ABQ4U744_9HYPH|nr:hypothetical protein MPOCJGCO_4831 [Methylobacterium trifolii]
MVMAEAAPSRVDSTRACRPKVGASISAANPTASVRNPIASMLMAAPAPDQPAETARAAAGLGARSVVAAERLSAHSAVRASAIRRIP